MNRPEMTATPPESLASMQADRSILASRILIADDESLVCRLIAGILTRQHYSNFSFASGGYSALEQIDTFQPDIILLDVQMPDLGGLEVCERIRARPECVDLPILIHSATFDRKEMGILFAAGASDFLSKPINPSELISRVTVHLERRKSFRELRHYRERTSQELEAARRMQFELLPAAPDQQRIAAAAGSRIASYSRSSSEIGGDFWGVLPVSEGSFGVFLADFAGHGVTAALNTFRLHALIHEHKNLHHDPCRLLAMLNERLVGMLSPGQFATFLYAVLEPKADRLRLASAGAPPLIVSLGRNGSTDLIEASGLPLGVIRGAEYQLHECAFPPDSTLLMFSDGLSEFPDPQGIRIGDEALRGVVETCRHELTPHQVIDRVCRAAGIGADDALPDDVTIVCLDRRFDSAALADRDCGLGHDQQGSPAAIDVLAAGKGELCPPH
jgi:sigma-B regulation protein RsbU (phosphoserine phosphatase)